MLKIWITLVLLSMGWMLERSRHLPSWDSQSSLAEVQKSLGDQLPDHQIQLDSQLVRMGEELVKYGRTIGPNNKRSSFISKYYVCTTCHNLVQEDPDLSVSDPETRLDYAIEHQLPFLQGTTFKGIVNRESWYNDDYVKKYGDEKVKIAHENLREAIQLCAIECSQGRPMKDWEVEAVLAYFWTLEYTLGDLGLTQNDLDFLNKLAPTSEEKTVRTQWLRSFYSTKSPAHFYDAPIDKKIGYPGFTPDASRGQAIYELSCLSCHQPNGVSHYILDQSKLSFKHLEKMIEKDSHFSLYQIIAYGTYAIPGHRPYMPHYPEERMSKKQVEDLRAFIEEMAQ